MGNLVVDRSAAYKSEFSAVPSFVVYVSGCFSKTRLYTFRKYLAVTDSLAKQSTTLQNQECLCWQAICITIIM